MKLFSSVMLSGAFSIGVRGVRVSLKVGMWEDAILPALSQRRKA